MDEQRVDGTGATGASAPSEPSGAPGPTGYVGRYAPSPTGHLHLGNLRTAVVAWARARSVGGRFLVRVEDIDETRCRPEFEAQQLEDLRAVGVEWDGAPVRQSERYALYDAALLRLPVFPCFCSRKDIQRELQSVMGARMVRRARIRGRAVTWMRGSAASGRPVWRRRAGGRRCGCGRM